MRQRLLVALAAIFVMSAMVFTWGRVASAQSFNTGSDVTITGTVDKTVFAAGQTVNINADVDGDIFCGGQTVTISGNVRGDIICGGQTITISGQVDGDIRLAGQTVSVGAVVNGNATIGAQTFTLSNSGVITGDATIGSQTTTINGGIGRDVTIGSENATVSGTVGRNITGQTTKLTLTKTANVAGSITYTSNNELTRQDGAAVGGTITRNTPTKQASMTKQIDVFGLGIAWLIYMLLAFVFAGLIIALLFPQVLRTVSQQAIIRPWKTLLVGFLSGFVAPALIALLAATIIGIPLAVVIGIAWVLILSLSGIFAAFYLGRVVLRHSTQAVVIMLTGTALLGLSYFVPILGFLTFLAATWFGVGMILLELFQRTPNPAHATTAKPTTAKS